MIIEGVAGRFATKLIGQVVARFTGLGSLAAGQVEPSGAELSRAGRRFHLAYTGAPTGIAPVQAIPTTAAQWAFFNADSARSYFFETLGAFPASGTPGVGGQLLAAFFTLPSQSGFTATLAAQSASNGNQSTKMAIKSAVTITAPTTPAWFPVAENLSPNIGAFPGSGLMVDRAKAGRIALPPNTGLALAVLALAGTTPLFVPVAEWVEYETDNE